MVGSAVDTIVPSSAASSMTSTSPPKTTRTFGAAGGAADWGMVAADIGAPVREKGADRLELPVPSLELRRLAEQRVPGAHPLGHPLEERRGGDARRAERVAHAVRAREQRVGGLVADDGRLASEQAAELARDVADAEELGAGDVDDEGRRGGMREARDGERVGVPLPDDVHV